MDAYQSNAGDLTYSDAHPILVAASSEAAMGRAERSVQLSGLRVGARLPIEQAVEALARQARTTALWVEIDRDCGAAMDQLLDAIAKDVREERYVAVVSTRMEMLDAVAARVDEPGADIIVNATDSERVAAVATALAFRGSPRVINDVAADRNAERLRQLSDEMSRIASTLARLSSGPAAPSGPPGPMPVDDVPPLSADMVRNVIRARRLRARYFQEDLFADPAWDMLLDLLQAEIAQLRVPVSSLCIAAAVPATTALRWLKTMVTQGLFVRREDPHDGRRVFVELAPSTSEALRRYFGELGAATVI